MIYTFEKVLSKSLTKHTRYTAIEPRILTIFIEALFIPPNRLQQHAETKNKHKHHFSLDI